MEDLTWRAAGLNELLRRHAVAGRCVAEMPSAHLVDQRALAGREPRQRPAFGAHAALQHLLQGRFEEHLHGPRLLRGTCQVSYAVGHLLQEERGVQDLFHWDQFTAWAMRKTRLGSMSGLVRRRAITLIIIDFKI